MARKDDITLAKHNALKRLRARVRLEMVVIGDTVLNDLIPAFEAEFDRRVAAGQSYELVGYDNWVSDSVAAKVSLQRADG